MYAQQGACFLSHKMQLPVGYLGYNHATQLGLVFTVKRCSVQIDHCAETVEYAIN